MENAKEPQLSLNKDAEKSPSGSNASVSHPASGNDAAAPSASEAPAFVTLQGRSGMLGDLLRVILIVLSLAMIAGAVLVLLPQPAINKLVGTLQSRYEAKQQEKFALLYLGDAIQGNDFKVRGAVRNISSAPIEQLDAVVRFIAQDGRILETTVVRMNRDVIAPGEIALFELVYPNYKMEFASYAVEFKLRQGDVVPYKDMRRTPAQTN